MAVPTKTIGVSLLPLQSVAAGAVVTSAVQNVATKFVVSVGIHLGRRAITALTAGVEFRIEGSMQASGDSQWFPLASFSSGIVAAEGESVTGTVAAGTNLITLASTTGLTVGDTIFLDNSVIANSEFGRIEALVVNTSVTIDHNLVNAQTGSTVYDQAEYFSAVVPVDTVGRIRLVVDAKGTATAPVAVEAWMNSLDSIG